MEIEQRTTSYLISFSRGKDTQRTSVIGVSNDESLVSIVRNTFKGRFKRPDALTPKDGVRIIIKKIDYIKRQTELVMNVRIFNKSPRQARTEVERVIRISK